MFTIVKLQTVTLSNSIQADIASQIKLKDGLVWLKDGSEYTAIPLANNLTVAGTYTAALATTMVTATLNGTELTISADAGGSDLKTAVSNAVSWNQSSVSKVIIEDDIVAGEDLSSLFFDYSSLKSIEGLDKLNTEKVTNMGSMFDGCTSLENLDLSSFNTEQVQYMSNMFFNCSGLASLDLSGFATAEVTDMESIFDGCSSLESLDLSSFNTAEVECMNRMFDSCTSLQSLDLSSFNTAKVEYMTDMFANVELKSITLSDSIQAGISNQILLKEGYEWLNGEATYDAIPLTNDNAYAIAGTYTAEGPTMVTATLNGEVLTISEDTDSNTDLLAAVNAAVSTDEAKASVNKVIITSDIVAGTSLFELFDGYTNLESIEGLDKINTDKVTDMESMFSDCSNLSSLDLSGFNTEKVTNMSGMFYYCSSLSSLDLSSFNTAEIMVMSGMFADCSSLDSLDLSGFNTDKVQYMNSMFANCTSLVSLDLSGFNTAEVTDMSGMFDYVKLQTVTLSDSIQAYIASQIKPKDGYEWLNGETIYDAIPTAGDYAVAGTYTAVGPTMVSATLNEGVLTISPNDSGTDLLAAVKAAVSDEAKASVNKVIITDSIVAGTSLNELFFCYTNLESIEGLDKINTEKVWDMSNMFTGCSNLSSLDLSGFNTETVWDMSNMFNGCSGLASLDLSNFNTVEVENMWGMFNGCRGLANLDLSGFNTAKVENMDVMFDDVKLQTVTLSDSIQAYIANQILPKDGYEWVKDETIYDAIPTAEGYAVAGTYTAVGPTMVSATLNGEVLTISEDKDSNTDLLAAVKAAVSDDNKSSVTKVIITDSIVAGTDLSWLFNGYTELKSIEGLDKINTEKVEYMGGMFDGCTSLVSLDLSGFNTEKVWYMDGMFYGCTSLVSLDLSGFNTAEVENMWGMFVGCTSLTSLNLSGFNTDKVWDMGWMFNGCTSLKSLDLSGFNTEKVTNMSDMFAGVTLKTVTLNDSIQADIAYQILPKDGYEWVKDGVIYNAIPLATGDAYAVAGTYTTKNWATMVSATLNGTELTISPDADSDTDLLWAVINAVSDKESVTKIIITDSIVAGEDLSYLFESYTELKSIEGLTKINTEKVTNMSGIFAGCSNLSSLDLSGFDTEKVENMSGMFSGCTSLSSLNLSGFNTDKVTNMSGMFSDCSNLSSLDLSGFNTEKVTNMNFMFAGCSSLDSLDLSGFNTAEVTDMSGMFAGCSSLDSLDLSGFNTAEVENMDVMFNGVTLQSISLSDSIQAYIAYQILPKDGLVWLKDGSEYTAIPLANNLTVAGTYKAAPATKVTAFQNDSVLTISPNESGTDLKAAVTAAVSYDNTSSVSKIIITDSIVAGVSLRQLFDGYTELKSIEGLDKINTEKVTDMSLMFYDCNSLGSLDLSSFNTENVTSMCSMFSGCSSLASLDLSGFNTEKVEYINNMFYGCSSLASLDLSSFNTANATDMGYMFYDCRGLDSLDLSNFNTEKVTNMSNMFNGCRDLSSLDLSGFNTEKVKYVSGMFNDCSSLNSLNLSGFNTEKVQYMSNMFKGCSSLESLDLSSFNTAAVTSMSNMFSGVTLQTVTLSDSIQAGIASQILLKDGYEWVKDGAIYNAIPFADDNAYAVAGTYTAEGIIDYTITYNLDNGTNDDSNPDTYTVEDNITLTDASKEGFTFAGWYAEDTFENEVTEITLGSTGNKELFAKWEITLAYAKELKKATVDTLANSVTKADYTAASWAVFQAAITADKDAIDACITVEAVEAYAITADVADLVTVASVADVFKTTHATALALITETVAIDDKDMVNAALADYAVLATEVQTALLEEKTLLNTLSAKIAELEAAAELTAAIAAKKAAIDALNTYVQADYRATEWTALEAIFTDAKAEVDAFTTISQVEAYDISGLTALADAIKTDATLTAEEATTDAAELAASKTAKKAAIDALNTYSESDYRATEWTALEAIFTDAKAEVDAFTTISQIEAYDISGLTALADAIKTDAELTEEETTAIQDVATAKPFTQMGSVLQFAEPTQVAIYSLSGAMLFSGVVAEYQLQAAGVYVVRTSVGAFKVMNL